MVVENFDTFVQWLLPNTERFGAIIYCAILMGAGSLAFIFVGYVIAAFRFGLQEGFYSVATVIAGAIPDFLRISLRRVFAIARLSIKESIRARVVVAFAVYLVVLMYARWFLDPGSDSPAKLYMLFVINATTYLMLVLSIFIGTFSLPNDMKNRTIYTIVTKPVRSSEIVMGRMLGFSIVATVLLAAMAAVGYVFVVRSLSHTHSLEDTTEEITAALEKDGIYQGRTTMDQGHRHAVTITPDQEAFLTDATQRHRHEVYLEDGEYVVSRPVDQLQARVPQYGKMTIRSRTGAESDGLSVGKEWTYRKYVEGQTLSAAIWSFSGVRAERFDDELPLELTLAVFRTYKGDMTKGVKGSIRLRNPGQNPRFRQSVPITFFAKEFEVDRHYLPRKIQAVRASDGAVVEADLFDDLCDEDGNLEIWIACEDRNQYFGVAQGDLYVLQNERSFGLNYIKGFLGVWFQSLLVICFGVMVSTRLNGAISMLSTLCYIVMGNFRDSIMGVFKGMWDNNPVLANTFGIVGGKTEELMGGGPIESSIRLLTQKSMKAELDMGWLAEGIIKWTDVLLQTVMVAVTNFAPNMPKFNTARYLAEGYDINGHIVATQATSCLTYMAVMLVLGYFFLKTREIAAA